MTTLHLAAGDAAAGNLALALTGTGRDAEVLGLIDDLSCGPIGNDDPKSRAAWWGEWWAPAEGSVQGRVESFWNRVTTTNDQLVVWFGRHSAIEHAFFLAVADRLGEKPYCVVDVTGAVRPITRHDGTSGLSRPAQAVASTPPEALRSLLTTRRAATSDEKQRACARWRQLKTENAPFRIVSEAGLISADVTYFDPWILECASAEWQKMARIIGNALGNHWEPYIQVGDGVLQTRMIELIAKGVLSAEGDPWDMQACRVRLAKTG
jgi:hypothetical protein